MLKKLFQTPFFSRFDPNGKSKSYQNRFTLITAVVLLIFTTAMGCFALYFAAESNLSLLHRYFDQPLLVILNVLPYILIAFLVWFLFRRAWPGFLSASVLCTAYSFTEYWKLSIRSEPFFAEDLGLISEAARISDGYLFFDSAMILFLIGNVLFTALLFLFFRGGISAPRWRWISASLLLICCVLLYPLVYTPKPIYDMFPAENSSDEWIEKEAYVARGGTYPFLYSIQDAVTTPPDHYDKKTTEILLDSYADDPIPEDKKVNVIFVMYEAYADLSQELGDRLSRDPYRYYHQLQSESYHGELLTDTYGGGTICTERSVITGFSDTSYRFRAPSWSYAQYFSDNGYVTEGSHGGNATFYNRLNINENLGFDQYYFIEGHFDELAEGHPMDIVFLPEVTRLCKEQIDAGNDLYSFNVTFQNHGPYPTVLCEGYSEYVPQGDLGYEDYAIINNYLNGIADTNYHMKNMVDSFRSYDEPVVLVFFGDHKPSLGTAYDALGIPVLGSDLESQINTYQTEYLIWANDAAKDKLGKDFSGIGPLISPCFLPNLLFEQCGWEGPSYLKVSDNLLQKISVLSCFGMYYADEEWLLLEDLPEEYVSLLRMMNHSQFYLAHDKKIE